MFALYDLMSGLKTAIAPDKDTIFDNLELEADTKTLTTGLTDSDTEEPEQDICKINRKHSMGPRATPQQDVMKFQDAKDMVPDEEPTPDDEPGHEQGETDDEDESDISYLAHLIGDMLEKWKTQVEEQLYMFESNMYAKTGEHHRIVCKSMEDEHKKIQEQLAKLRSDVIQRLDSGAVYGQSKVHRATGNEVNLNQPAPSIMCMEKLQELEKHVKINNLRLKAISTSCSAEHIRDSIMKPFEQELKEQMKREMSHFDGIVQQSLQDIAARLEATIRPIQYMQFAQQESWKTRSPTRTQRTGKRKVNEEVGETNKKNRLATVVKLSQENSSERSKPTDTNAEDKSKRAMISTKGKTSHSKHDNTRQMDNMHHQIEGHIHTYGQDQGHHTPRERCGYHSKKKTMCLVHQETCYCHVNADCSPCHCKSARNADSRHAHRQANGAVPNQVVLQQDLWHCWLPTALESVFSCTICHNLVIDATVMTCGHLFCGNCLRSALMSTKDKPANQLGTCPVCKQGDTPIALAFLDNYIQQVVKGMQLSENYRAQTLAADRRHSHRKRIQDANVWNQCMDNNGHGGVQTVNQSLAYAVQSPPLYTNHVEHCPSPDQRKHRPLGSNRLQSDGHHHHHHRHHNHPWAPMDNDRSMPDSIQWFANKEKEEYDVGLHDDAWLEDVRLSITPFGMHQNWSATSGQYSQSPEDDWFGIRATTSPSWQETSPQTSPQPGDHDWYIRPQSPEPPRSTEPGWLEPQFSATVSDDHRDYFAADTSILQEIPQNLLGSMSAESIISPSPEALIHLNITPTDGSPDFNNRSPLTPKDSFKHSQCDYRSVNANTDEDAEDEEGIQHHNDRFIDELLRDASEDVGSEEPSELMMSPTSMPDSPFYVLPEGQVRDVSRAGPAAASPNDSGMGEASTQDSAVVSNDSNCDSAVGNDDECLMDCAAYADALPSNNGNASVKTAGKDSAARSSNEQSITTIITGSSSDSRSQRKHRREGSTCQEDEEESRPERSHNRSVECSIKPKTCTSSDRKDLERAHTSDHTLQRMSNLGREKTWDGAAGRMDMAPHGANDVVVHGLANEVEQKLSIAGDYHPSILPPVALPKEYTPPSGSPTPPMKYYTTPTHHQADRGDWTAKTSRKSNSPVTTVKAGSVTIGESLTHPLTVSFTSDNSPDHPAIHTAQNILIQGNQTRNTLGKPQEARKQVEYCKMMLDGQSSGYTRENQ